MNLDFQWNSFFPTTTTTVLLCSTYYTHYSLFIRFGCLDTGGRCVRMSTSVSIPEDLQPYIMAYREKGGKISDLVCRLLRMYFGSSVSGYIADPAIMEALTVDLQNRLGTLQENVVQIREQLEAINARKASMSQQEQEVYHKLNEYIDQQFDDRTEIKTWISECGGKAAFARSMQVRCGIVATKAGVPLEVAKREILSRYPELEEYLNA